MKEQVQLLNYVAAFTLSVALTLGVLSLLNTLPKTPPTSTQKPCVSRFGKPVADTDVAYAKLGEQLTANWLDTYTSNDSCPQQRLASYTIQKADPIIRHDVQFSFNVTYSVRAIAFSLPFWSRDNGTTISDWVYQKTDVLSGTWDGSHYTLTNRKPKP